MAATKIFRSAIDTVAAALLAGILIVTFARVVGRYLLGEGMAWSEELVRLMFVWLVMIASARTVHLRIDVLLQALGEKARFHVEVAIALFGVALLIFLAWADLGVINLVSNDYYTVLGISVQYLYWSVIFGAALWIVGTFLALLVPLKEHELPPS